MARSKFRSRMYVMHRMKVPIDAERRRLEHGARRALELSVAEGAVHLQDLLEAAETRTGQERVTRGGISAGRHETGNMVASVSHDGDRLPRGDYVIGSFGWFSAEFERYFRAQDLGAGQIPAANALHQAAAYARQRYAGRMYALVHGKGDGS